MTLLDVSHPLFTGMPGIPTLPAVDVAPWSEMSQGAPLSTSRVTVSSHSGTHIDAPIHAVEEGQSIDQIPLERFTGPGVVLSVPSHAGDVLTVDQLLAGGPAVQRGDMVLVHTGWDAQFGEAAYHDHPSLSPGVGEWAVDTGINLLGVDTLTPDLPVARRGEGFEFPLHRTLLGNGVLIAENLRGLGDAAGQRVTVYAFPVSVRGGDAGSVRMVLELP